MLPRTRNETSLPGLFSDLAHGLREVSQDALSETLLGSLAFPWQHIHFVLRRPRHQSLSLVDRAQSSREGFESSLSIICDTLRVCFAGQIPRYD